MADDASFIPLDIRPLADDLPPVCDLFIREGTRSIKYKNSTQPFTMEDRQKLLEKGITRLWVLVESKQDDSPESDLPNLLALPDDHLPPPIKAKLLYNSAKVAIADTVNKAFTEGLLLKINDSVTNSINYLTFSDHSLSNMLAMMHRDYSIYTHSVNVAIYTLGFAKYIGITDEQDLHALGLGAILHDVGMTKIPREVLYKKGSLTNEEWATIKQHPQWGVEMMTGINLPDVVFSTVLQHHERQDGSGYPNGLTGDEIHRFSKIMALTDTFEALTSSRPHRPSMAPFNALSLMRQESASRLDHDLFVKFVYFLGDQPQSNLSSAR